MMDKTIKNTQEEEDVAIFLRKLESSKGPEAGSLKNFRSVITQTELRHNSKDDLVPVCEKVVTEL
jgi:hypothetical protein